MSQEEDIYQSNMVGDLTPPTGEMPNFEPQITPQMQAQIEGVKDPIMREVTRLVMNLVSQVRQESHWMYQKTLENNGGLRKMQLANMKKKSGYTGVLMFILGSCVTAGIGALFLKWIHP